MAKNLGRKFATMSDDERRRFALEEEAGSRELPAELSFEDPRALLDDEQQERAVRESETARNETEPE